MRDHLCQADASEAPVATYPFTAPAGRQPTFMLPAYRPPHTYTYTYTYTSHMLHMHIACTCRCACVRAHVHVRVLAQLHLQSPTALRSTPPSYSTPTVLLQAV